MAAAALRPYDDWSATCDTLHGHTQVLGKLAVALAPPEPQLQHSALLLTGRGWETRALPAPDGSGAFTAALDLRSHEAVVEHSTRGAIRIPLTPDRAVGEVTGALLAAVGELAGTVAIDPTPQEAHWEVPLDTDGEHATYDPDAVVEYFAAATEVALALAEFRAPYRGRSTRVNAWWGSFDLAVNLFSGVPADPPADDFIVRNAMDVEEFAVGWWPGDPRYPRPALYAYAHPAPPGFADGDLGPAGARWDDTLGEYVLDWADVVAQPDPRAHAVEFFRSAFQHACAICGWPAALAASAEGDPPPVV